MDLKLKTLTPLHIGNGEEMHSLDYVVYGNLFYRVSERMFQKFLQNFEKEEVRSHVNVFLAWTRDLTIEIEDLESKKKKSKRNENDFNQQLSSLKKEFNYRSFAKKIEKEDEFTQFLKNNIEPTKISNGTKLKHQVRGMIRTGKRKPYLPGSSLKGAIRTALFYHVLKNHISSEKIEDLLENSISKLQDNKRTKKDFNLESEAKYFADNLTHLAFFCKKENSAGKEIVNDEKLDLLKLLFVSDSYPIDNEETLENVDSYLVTKKKDKRNNKTYITSEKQSQTPSIEAIASGQKIKEANLNFNIEFLYNLKFNRKKQGSDIKVGSEIFWIEIDEKIEQIFGLKMTDIKEKSDVERPAHFQELEEKVINHIIDCVRRFSQKQLEESKEWLNHFVEHDNNSKFSDDIKAGFEQVMERGNGNLINLGYASGFDATTVFYYLLDNQKPQLKEIMELFGIGDKPGSGKKTPGKPYLANPDNFPKSKRLITRQNEIMPLGWLEIMNGPEVPEEERSVVIQEPEVPAAPVEPRYLRGKLKPGTILDGEIISVGKQNKVQLFIAEDNLQTIDIRYGAGFDADKIGKLIEVKVGAVTRKGQVQSGAFKGFR